MGRAYCSVRLTGRPDCGLRSLSLLGMDLLFSERTFLPSFPALPTLKAGSNDRVTVFVVGQQAALVTRRQLWQSPAPPQLLCCGRVSREALWLWDRQVM